MLFNFYPYANKILQSLDTFNSPKISTSHCLGTYISLYSIHMPCTPCELYADVAY